MKHKTEKALRAAVRSSALLGCFCSNLRPFTTRWNLGFASWTNIDIMFRSLEYRLLSLAVTVSTNPMRRIRRFLRWTVSVNKASAGKWMHSVVSFFFFPVVVCCELLCQIFILLKERVLILNDSQMLDLQIGKSFRKFRQSLMPFSFVASLNRCLGYVGCVTERGDECGDFDHGGDVFRPNIIIQRQMGSCFVGLCIWRKIAACGKRGRERVWRKSNSCLSPSTEQRRQRPRAPRKDAAGK